MFDLKRKKLKDKIKHYQIQIEVVLRATVRFDWKRLCGNLTSDPFTLHDFSSHIKMNTITENKFNR